MEGKLFFFFFLFNRPVGRTSKPLLIGRRIWATEQCEWNDKLERLKKILHEDLAQEQLAELLRNAGNTLENSPVLVF